MQMRKRLLTLIITTLTVSQIIAQITPYERPYEVNKVSRVGDYPKIKEVKPWDGRTAGDYSIRIQLKGLQEGEMVFLDLTMPVMDGYQVLEEIVKQDLNTLTVVISGDIQPEAHERVKRLGALDFIQKPVNKNKLTEILLQYGLFTCEDIFDNFTPSEFDTSDYPEPMVEHKMARLRALDTYKAGIEN